MSDEPVKSRRGGARPGSGRKRKIAPPPPPPPAAASPPEAKVEDATPEDVILLARSFSKVAVRVLATVAVRGTRDASRVSAARAILETAHLIPPEPAAEVELGKKELIAEAADRAGENSGWGDLLKTPPLYRN